MEDAKSTIGDELLETETCGAGMQEMDRACWIFPQPWMESFVSSSHSLMGG